LSRSDLAALDANAYLALLGHFRFAGFDRLFQEVWGRHQDEVLWYAIWAAARCPLQDVGGVLGPMVIRVAELPVRQDYAANTTEREWLTLQLSWGFRRGMTPEALVYLLEAARRDQTLQQDVSLMVEGVDHSDAIEFLVRHLAGGGHSNLWMHLDAIGDIEPETVPRSSRTADRLRNLWQSADESDKVRAKAFCIWLRAAGWNDADALRAIRPGSPFYRYAVLHRLKLSDLSVVGDLLQLLRSDDLGGYWWVLSYRVWCKELLSLASETLAKLHGTLPTDFSGGWENHHWQLADLIVRIPVGDAEELLRSHWGHLKYIPRMVHAAFRIGTPTCVTLAGVIRGDLDREERGCSDHPPASRKPGIPLRPHEQQGTSRLGS
jgi:hypothetical protein